MKGRASAGFLAGPLLLVAVLPATAVSAGYDRDGFPSWRSDSLIPELASRRVRGRRPRPDSLEALSRENDADSATGFLVIRRNPVLSGVMWPVDKIVSPVVQTALQPLRSPVVYAEDNGVIDRAVDLVSFDDDKSFLYPTMMIDGTPLSRLGVTLIHRPWEAYHRVAGSFMVNRNWYASDNFLTPPILPLDGRLRLRFSVNHSSAVPVWAPGASDIGTADPPGYVREDRSSAEAGWGVPLPGGWGVLETGTAVSARWIGDPDRGEDVFRDTSLAWFHGMDRGLRGDEYWAAAQLRWSHGDVDREGISARGGRQSLFLQREWSHGGGDGVTFQSSFSHFFLLGKEVYRYRVGDLQVYQKLVDPKGVLELLDPRRLRSTLVQRKILAVHVRLARAWELEEPGSGSYFLFPSLGTEAPARAYGMRRVYGQAVAGAAADYRWPVWKYLDGTAFAELAWSGDEWWEVRRRRLAPGWGMGFRARTPSQFLFRGYVAWGLEGPTFNITVDPEF